MSKMKCTTGAVFVAAVAAGLLTGHESFSKFTSAIYDLSYNYDLESYNTRHKELYAKAIEDDSYADVVMHYYTVQARFLQLMIGKYWHFIPESPGLSRDENFDVLNQHFAKYLSLKPNDTLCEIGCGLCRTGRDVAQAAGAKFIGLTLSPHEVELGNKELRELGLDASSTVIQGNYLNMPHANATCDALLAVYTLKYATPGTKLNDAFAEIFRVLKPKGRFVSYEIITTASYDERNADEAGWIYNISYHTGMPPLANIYHYRNDAPSKGLMLISEYDLATREGVRRVEHGFPFNLYFGRIYEPLVSLADWLGVKIGLYDWYINFAKHPTEDFIAAMAKDVITTSTIFTYEKSVA